MTKHGEAIEQRACEKCGQKFSVYKSETKRFCSMRCFYAAKDTRQSHTMLNAIYEKNPKFAHYLEGINVEATKRTYAYKIVQILGEEVDSFLSKTKQERKSILEEFVFQNNRNEVSKSSTKLAVTAAKSFLYDAEIDDGELFWTNLNKKVKTNGTPEEDEAPSPDVVRSFCETVSFRDRVITAVLCSSGMRVGGLVDLRVGDYKRLPEGIGQLYVYASDAEARYMALCSEEACDLIERYLELRRNHGEDITPKSWLFRDIYDPLQESAVKNPNKIGERPLEDKFNSLWNKSGLRQATHSKIYELKSLNETRKFSRYRFKSVHCFRKFFKTQLVSDRFPEAMSERLLGHGGGLIDNYYRTGNPASEAWQSLVKEYKSHTASLAIDEKYRRKSEVAVELAKVATEQDEKITRLEQALEAQRVLAEKDRAQAEKDREEMRELIKSIRKNVKED